MIKINQRLFTVEYPVPDPNGMGFFNFKDDGFVKSTRLSDVQRFREESAKGAGVKNFMLFEELATSS
jgi:hypothetical protein